MYTIDICITLRQVDNYNTVLCCPALMHRQQFTHRNTQILTKTPGCSGFLGPGT